MAQRSPTSRHSYWGQYADSASLPNVAGSLTQSNRLEAGDTAFNVDATGLFVCTDATLGAAVWVGSTGVGLHANTHTTGQTDEIDGDKLNVTYVPVNYTRDNTAAEADVDVDLASHLKGIDNELASTVAHASTHITGGADEIDGDQLDIDFTPVNYVPVTSPAEASDVDHLTAHLAGVDNELGQMLPGTTLSGSAVVAGQALVANQIVRIGAAAGVLNFTLPPVASVNIGDVYALYDENGTASSFSHTITPDATDTINGVNAAIELDDEYGLRALVKTSATNWSIVWTTAGSGAAPVGIVTLTSSSNQVAIDSSLGTQFKLNDLGEDTEIQLPTNGVDGTQFTMSIEQDGTGRTVTFAAGWVNVGQLDVSDEAGRVSIVSVVARDYGAGLEWAYAVSHAETIVGITDVDATLQTVDATASAIVVFATTTDNAAYMMEISITAIDKTAGHVYETAFRSLVYRDGVSALTVRNTNFYSTYDTDDPTWDVTIAIVGQNIVVNVTGDATNAVDWRAKGAAKEVA